MFKGLGIFIEPTLGATYRFTKCLYFSLGGGCEVDFLGGLKLSRQESTMEWNSSLWRADAVFTNPK